MKTTIVTIVSFLFVTGARAADIATTFHFDPTLSREANPIVSQFGAGAAVFLWANAVGLVVLHIWPLLCSWRGHRPSFPQPPANVWGFVSFTFYRRLMPRREVIRALVTCWPPPKDWFQVCRAWGVVGSWAVGMGSLAAALTWWAIELSPSFHAIHAATVLSHWFPIIPLLARVIGAVPGWKLFVACEFSKHDSKCT